VRLYALGPDFHYLYHRFLDSAQCLVREAGSSLANLEVCDNIDLPTILQVPTPSLAQYTVTPITLTTGVRVILLRQI